MATFDDASPRPAAQPDPLHERTASPPAGPPTPTMDLDTGLPWGVEGETIQAENAELRRGD